MFFLKCVPTFFFENCLKRVLFCLKVRLSLDLLCLESTMLVFVTNYSSNLNVFCYRILMAELEEELPKSRWPTYGDNFLISSHLYKIFGRNFQKALFYTPVKFFLPQIACFLSHILTESVLTASSNLHLIKTALVALNLSYFGLHF